MRNKLREPFLLLASVTILLSVLSFLRTTLKTGNFFTKEINLFSDVEARPIIFSPIIHFNFLKTIVPKNDTITKRIDAGGLAEIEAFGNHTSDGLSHFFKALDELTKKKRKVRIAYFGDSMIEGDLITQDFRTLLQKKFGGSGVGYMPITSIVAGFRQTVLHSFSKNWQTNTLLDPSSSNYKLGMSGYVFTPAALNKGDSINKNDCWVKYTAVNKERLNKFYTIKLYYGSSNNDNYLIYNNKKIPLTGTNQVNEIVLNEYPVQSIHAAFSCTSPVNIFGVSIESDSGIFVDNFSFRGNSGMPLTKIPSAILRNLDYLLHYDLIVLHYGVNVLSHNETDYSWYERGMINVVNHLKNNFQNTSILIISAGDKSYRENGKYMTEPAVPMVVATQRNVAEKTNASFWNLYQAMGGENSMIKWVEGDTVLANKDYTHFNYKGAQKVAKLLHDQLMNSYNKYKKRNASL